MRRHFRKHFYAVVHTMMLSRMLWTIDLPQDHYLQMRICLLGWRALQNLQNFALIPGGADHLEPSRKKQQRSNTGVRSLSSIRPRSPSVSSTLSEWSELNATLAKSKALDREDNKLLHDEKMDMKRDQFQRTCQLEERRVICKEDKTKSRVLLIQTQVAKEQLQAKREEFY
ncbi:unnamed protein product [Phytophthora fragariaefolia]|uniref:Unnamed protein product n=1 Tax=Phytophthora fragariaefolia TaxID=1490495 RepID=A0A9W6X7F3_9STRA|nr:unnamed protein product [Phytophthora fragariaefolia]